MFNEVTEPDLLRNWPGIREPEENSTYTKLKIVEELKNRGNFTPDFKSFRNSDGIAVFIYDGMKRFGLQNTFFKESIYLGEAYTTTELYTMRLFEDFPVVFDVKQSNQEKAYVRGDVYVITPDNLLALDKIKKHTIAFRRAKRSCVCIDQKYPSRSGNKSPAIPVQMYLGIESFWGPFNGRLSPRISSRPDYTKKTRSYFEYFAPRQPLFNAHQHRDYGWEGMMH